MGNDRRAPLIELRPCDDGVVEIWMGGELVGQIDATDRGISLQMGDADPRGGATLLWAGSPFRMSFDLLGGMGQ